MRSPFGNYGPEPESDSQLAYQPGDRFRWLPWLQLALTSALLVLFFNQLMQVQDANRKIARLYERMDLLERSRMMDTSAALEAQQRSILQRLMVLETQLRDAEVDRQSSSSSEAGSAALKPPPPPSALP